MTSHVSAKLCDGLDTMHRQSYLWQTGNVTYRRVAERFMVLLYLDLWIYAWCHLRFFLVGFMCCNLQAYSDVQKKLKNREVLLHDHGICFSSPHKKPALKGKENKPDFANNSL